MQFYPNSWGKCDISSINFSCIKWLRGKKKEQKLCHYRSALYLRSKDLLHHLIHNPFTANQLLIAMMGRKINFIFTACVLVFCLLAVCVQMIFLTKLLLLLLAKRVREQARLCTCLELRFRQKIQTRNCTVRSIKQTAKIGSVWRHGISNKLLDFTGCLED